MKFSEQWLREWINPPVSREKLLEQLTLAGLEVDSVTPVAGSFNNVVVGQVIDVNQHPNADRLRVCQVDVGEADLLEIVCGAANVRKDLKVAVAKIGAILPGNFKIKKNKLRGVESCGMLCSETELGIAESSEGIVELANDAQIGQDLRDYFKLDDVSIDIDLTPNRGDCLSILGIAREVAAINKQPLTPQAPLVTPVVLKDSIPVSISAQEACPHYVGRIIKNINTSAQTPLWMKEKLRRSDIRSISLVVDVTNYVLLELGQPLHAFDFNHIKDGILVRFAKSGEQISLLDNQQLVLDENDLVITSNDKPIALAGIKGGSDSGITSTTKDIFLESALFNPTVISKTSHKFEIYTDSSHRYERSVDYKLQHQAIERASSLILEIAGGELGEMIEVGKPFEKRASISFRPERISRILGINLSAEAALDIFNRLGMEVVANGASYKVTPPSYRHDISLEIDLIEEIARLYGYNNIPEKKIHTDLNFLPEPETKLSIIELKRLLVNRGYQEAITYSFVDPLYEKKLLLQENPLQLVNPIASDLAAMRTNHWPALIKSYLYNANRQQPRVRLFEIGLCFLNTSNQMIQNLRLGGLASGSLYPEQWGESKRTVDFYDIKGDLENLLAITRKAYQFTASSHPALHPGKSANIMQGEKIIGFVGALNPSLSQEFDINQELYLFDLDLESIMGMSISTYEAISKFPAIRRDIALVVAADVPAARIKQKILDSGGELLKNVQIFDVYQGKGIEVGKKSIALSLYFQDIARTLVDSEINEIMQRTVNELHKNFNAILRD
jgi:phenylalanyl-tRNA synthetase beta chain